MPRPIAPYALLHCLLSLHGSPEAHAQIPQGSQFLVNTYTTSSQSGPSIASNPDGSFLVVWSSLGSFGSDVDSYSIQAQAFSDAGSPLSTQFQVNASTSGSQGGATVASQGQGFVVVWGSSESENSDTSGTSVHARKVDNAGSPIGQQFQVNEATTGNQGDARLAATEDGKFVVVWTGRTTTGPPHADSNIYGRRFEDLGVPIGSEFQVNTYSSGDQTEPNLAMAASGNFVVVWKSEPASGIDNVQGQRFSSGGERLGEEFQIGTYGTGDQLGAGIGMRSDGSFVVSWLSLYSKSGDEWSVQGQLFAPSGAPEGSQFQVSTAATQYGFRRTQPLPDQNGDFVVVWQYSPTYDVLYEIHGQRVDRSGNRVGNSFAISTLDSYSDEELTVATAPGGDFVVVWKNIGAPGADPDRSIQGQRFLSWSIFADGFETGDPVSWSELQPSDLQPSLWLDISTCFFQGGFCFGWVGDTIGFIDDSEGTITAYRYDFTHQGTSTDTCSFGAQQPTPTTSWQYDTAGTYRPCIEVIGPGGTAAALATLTIAIEPPNPRSPEPYR